MELKPKHSLPSEKDWKKGKRKRAERYFAGREVPRRELENAIGGKDPVKYEVLHYYGIGGIGKTRLQKEMMAEIKKRKTCILVGHLNFEASHLHQVDGALIELREQLKSEYKVRFDWFDLACAVLWKKTNPHLSFQSNQNDLPFIGEGTYLAELISLIDGLPFVQWVPKTIQFAQSISYQLKKWKMSSNDLFVMMTEIASLQAFEIEERLPMFFAEDVRKFLEKQDLTPILFIDTYEALSDKGRLQGASNEKEAWVKELILQLPEVLWVVFGRERLYWDREHSDWGKIVKQTLVDPLSTLDAEKFLIEENIVEHSIRTKMIEVSGGLPYQLDLLVDTYELIQEKKSPDAADFSDSSNLIVDRLLKYLTLPEREVLKVLSFPRQWDEFLFKEMVRKLAIGYPATAIDELGRFSFIDKISHDKWGMHPIMQNNFQRAIKEEQAPFYEQIHRVLFYEYKSLLDDYGERLDSKSEKYLNEIAFHAANFKLKPIEENHLVEATTRFYEAGRFKLFTPLSKDLQQVTATFTSAFSSAKIYAIVGYVASIQGRLDVALEQFELAEQHLDNVDSPAEGYFELALRIKREAATIHKKRTAYAQSRQLLLSACALESKMIYVDLQLVHVYLELGKLEVDRSNKTDAIKHYDKAFELVELFIAKEGKHAQAFSLKGAIYEKIGEWLSSKRLLEQREAYKSSVACYEEARRITPSLPLELETDRGLAWKRLAENYSKQQDLRNDTIQAFRTAISIYDEILIEHSEYVEALIKKGHAAVDFLRFLGEHEMYEEVEELFTTAIESFNQAIKLSTDQAAAHNRIASANREVAIIYDRMGKKELAQATFNKAIEESRRLFRHYPAYIHAQGTLDKTYNVMENLGYIEVD